MKKILLGVLFLMGTGFAQARITSSADDRDVWCVGVSGEEICIDSSGNVIPTTDDASDLGTSSLQFRNAYIDGTIYTDVISNEGAYTGTTGAFTSTLDVDGQTTLGAAATISTFPAAGSPTIHGTLTASVGLAGGTLSMTGAGLIAGQVTMGASATLSTVTAAGVATFSTSVGVPTTGIMYAGTRTIAQLMADTAVLGQFGICSDCSPVEMFISTAAGLGRYGNAAGAQLD